MKSLNPLDLLGSIVAGLGHDASHPSLTNKFLVVNRDDIAITYNDRSVLENMHASKCFEIMEKTGCNLLESLITDDWISIRKIIISMIMDTDMARHFELLGKFRSRTSTLGDINLEKSEDREVVMCMAIKCADLGHSAKIIELHEKWTALICEEFFHQGDLEKEREQPVSMYCDRENTDIPKSQVGFIKNICLPLYETWTNYLRSDTIYKNCIDQLRINMRNWEEKDRKN